MPRRKERASQPKLNPRKHFDELVTYMAKVAKGSVNRHNKYSLCVKASVSKCFEFNLAVQGFAKTKGAFFAMASLRGMCEDLIVLRYFSIMPSNDREELIIALTWHETNTRIKLQDTFFTAIRPQQPVVRVQDVDKAIGASQAAARAVWNRNGWPNLHNGAMPPTRQIAEKQGMHQLAVLYDYLYRLTSGSVHFNVSSLFRSGWGKSMSQFIFSSKNFDTYFEEYCSLYGAFLFCLYFEFFGAVLRPSAKERAIVDEIRREVLCRRWPEMVTHEEMNINPPAEGEKIRMLVTALQTVSRKRLISKGVNYNKKHNRERRLVTTVLRKLRLYAQRAGETAALRDDAPLEEIVRVMRAAARGT
jgi:Family of unknown function (DUF5677)